MISSSVQYGIAKYQGLRRLSVQDFDSDFLVLEFAGTDKLYVPLDRLNQVQRSAGPTHMFHDWTGSAGRVEQNDRESQKTSKKWRMSSSISMRTGNWSIGRLRQRQHALPRV